MRLILNADDFGLTPGINTAIAELHDAGALTSATLMAAGPAFHHAVALARARPTLGIGCHIVLTDGLPVSPPRSIPSLVTRTGTFRPKLTHFLAALLTRQIDPTDIEREATAQIQRLQYAGLTVTHLDTHKHTHIFPPVLAPLLRAALRTGVPAIRNPFDPSLIPPQNLTPHSLISQTSTKPTLPHRTFLDKRHLQLRALNLLKGRILAQPAIRSGQIRTTDGTLGISATGHLDESTLRNLLHALPDGTWELVTHPGYNDPDLDRIPTRLRQTRDIERQALLAVLSTAPRAQSSQTHPHLPPPELIHYGSLTKHHTSH